MYTDVLVCLDLSCRNATRAAETVQKALHKAGDKSSEVYEYSHESAIVRVHESNDAEEEITKKMNTAGLGCFVEVTSEVPMNRYAHQS